MSPIQLIEYRSSTRPIWWRICCSLLLPERSIWSGTGRRLEPHIHPLWLDCTQNRNKNVKHSCMAVVHCFTVDGMRQPKKSGKTTWSHSPSQAKVGDFHNIIVSDQDVTGGQITMNVVLRFYCSWSERKRHIFGQRVDSSTRAALDGRYIT